MRMNEFKKKYEKILKEGIEKEKARNEQKKVEFEKSVKRVLLENALLGKKSCFVDVPHQMAIEEVEDVLEGFIGFEYERIFDSYWIGYVAEEKN